MPAAIVTKNWLRQSFIVIAVAGFAFSLLFDLSAFRENRASDKKGADVAQSYEALLHTHILTGLLSNPNASAQKDEIHKELAIVKKFKSASFTKDIIKNLETQIRENSKESVATSNELYAAIFDNLQYELKNDFAANQLVDSEMMRTLILDLGLIIVMIGLFILNNLANHEAEKNLKKSMNNLRETLLSLEEENFKRRASIKTTVHDLKNPIGSILGFAQILEDEASSRASVIEFSEIIKRISERSLELVESMLTLDDGVSLPMSEIDITHLLEEVCTQMDVQANAKKQVLVRDFKLASAKLLGNRIKLEDLMANIIGNAIKYTPEKGIITVTLSLDNNSYQIEVEDQGPGFTAEDKLKAFQYGQKLSAKPTGGEASTGFGLFIAKQIVDLHDGQIKIADGSIGKGSRFVIHLPKLTEFRSLPKGTR